MNLITKPRQSLAPVPLLTEEERNQVLVEWNQTQADYPRDKCIHQLFEEQVSRTPEAVAVVFEGQQLTYKELNRRANQLAHYLQKLGVGPEILVGIYTERSLEMVVGLLGILKAGGAYVPLDPAYPQERLAFMLEDAQVSVLLTQQKLVETLPEHQTQLVCLDSDWKVISQESNNNLCSSVKLENLAYVIYTSGSTGKPKGVMIPHRGLSNLVFWHQRTFEVTPLDRATQIASTAFDASVWEIWPYLASGASLFLVSPEIIGLAEKLKNWLISQKITICFLPTPLAEPLVSLEWTEKVDLRIILTGGDKLHDYPQTSLPFQLINNYGPTENTVVTTSGVVAQTENQQHPPSIGRPINNTKIYILDSQLQPVPIGVAGELYISGAGLARGYLNRPELTAERFITNPFSNEPRARLYKTGDLARYLPDGNIEFLGRIDNQVKIRGFRIELGEIEAVLSQHPTIKQAVVISREDTPGDKRLVAYLVPNDPSSIQNPKSKIQNQWRGFLKQKLPDYMVPSAFVVLESLPLTPNGKIDRRALPAPDLSALNREDTFVPPRIPTEEILANIWTEILRVEPIGIHDNFFELGGHSLLATQVLSRLRQAFALELPLRLLFEAPTIAQLAPQILAARQTESPLPVPPISPRERQDALPLSFAQQRLWFLNQLEPDSRAYHLSSTFRLQGTLNIKALKESFEEIVRRYEILRTTFPTIEGQPSQVIASHISLSLPLIDLQELPPPQREIEAQRITREEAQQPFNLARGPLIRVKLLCLTPEEHFLLLNLHHIVFDGWSLQVLFEELRALYEAFAADKSSPLPELPIQYADFALWQREWLQGEVLETQLGYWQQQLGGTLPVLQLPTVRPRPPIQRFCGATESFTLDWELTRKLKTLAGQSGATLFMTLLAAFATLLARYSGQEDIVIGSPIANRNRGEIEGLIGFFANTCGLRVQLAGNPSFAQLLKQVQQVCLDAYAHQDIPFEQVVEALQLERNLSHSPLFQVMFVLQNAAQESLELPGLTLTPLEIHNCTAKFDLTLSMKETGEGLRGTWEYNQDLFDSTTIARMLGYFQTLLAGIAANPEQHLSDLPLLTEAEQHQLLVEGNDTRTDYPKQACIHQLFEEQVAKTPDAVAVIYDNQQLTYRELDRRANQLAHHLQKLGVKPEVLVGICLERSPATILGLLGILKAGGTYVPLDPDYPAERLAFMLEDTQMPVLLTQQSLVEKLPANQTQIVCLDGEWETISRQSEDRPTCGTTAENLAYVTYTSGSTGIPKGVAIPHQAVIRLLFNTNYIQLESKDRIAQVSNTSFDAATFEIWGALLHGGKLVLIPKNVLLSPQEFAAQLREKEISVLFLTTALFNQLASAVPQAFKNLRYLLFGGEAVESRWVQEILEKASPHRLLHVYGPTESTTFSSWYWVRNVPEGAKTVPIGRPISNTQIYILDRHLNPVPMGVPGELYIGGDGLARGYFNRPELTEEKFIANPFDKSKVKSQKSKLYKTGDLACYLPDGNIEFLGRIDNQVKIRGFRIELGEIEAVLSQHPAVRETVAIAKEDISGDKYLVSYIVLKSGTKPTVNELRCFLQQKLPTYMIPSAYVVLESLPLTPNGKINRLALPLPASKLLRQEGDGTFVPPQDNLERQLIRIWEKILGSPQIGVRDNFFALGGHSLLAVSLLAEIEKTFNQNIPLATLFQAPTIEELASFLRLQKYVISESSLVPIKTTGTKPPFFFVNSISYARIFGTYFEEDRPFYCLNIFGITNFLQPQLSRLRIEDIAAKFIEDMRSIQPNGPYFLGTYCGDSFLTFEIAQQLKAQGQEVAFLAFIDAIWEAKDLGLAFQWHNFRQFGTNYLLEKAKNKLRHRKDRLIILLKQIRGKFYSRTDIPLPRHLEDVNLLKAFERARNAYSPKIYPGKLTLFLSGELRLLNSSKLLSLVVGGVEIQEIPGYHHTLFAEPQVQVLAEKLKACIDKRVGI